MKNGYYYGKVYNETQYFDLPVTEGWNFIAFRISQDGSATYTRLSLIAASQSQMANFYKTFSYNFYDDVDYDLLFEGKFDYYGLNITTGFAEQIL